jgi:predicted kinase
MVQSSNIFIAMRGYPGTGKSTIARLLASSLHAPLIDRDILRQAAVDTFGNVPQVGSFSYGLMFALAREQLKLGLSVVVDTPLTYRRTYESCLEIASECSTPLLVVHCQCPPEVQKHRLEERKGQVSNFQITSWEEWERWKDRYEDYDDHGCVIDTSYPMEESLAKVMRCIQEVHHSYALYPHEELPNTSLLS